LEFPDCLAIIIINYTPAISAAGIALSSSSPEEKWVSPRSSESSTMSASTILFFVAGAHDGDGAAEVDSSGTSMKSRPGYSPTSGWGG
jgi:hypothetical protein